MQLPIVLLGPFRAGKTTLAKLLAARLGLPQVSLDEGYAAFIKSAACPSPLDMIAITVNGPDQGLDIRAGRAMMSAYSFKM